MFDRSKQKYVNILFLCFLKLMCNCNLEKKRIIPLVLPQFYNQNRISYHEHRPMTLACPYLIVFLSFSTLICRNYFKSSLLSFLNQAGYNGIK